MEPLFREGGPHGVRRTSDGNFEMKVSVPTDKDGMVGRRCPNDDCSPGYFKVKLGTGVVGAAEPRAFCPYCRREDHPQSFATKSQLDYAFDTVKNEALQGVHRMLKDSLGLDASGRKRLGGPFVSVEMSLEAPKAEVVRRPVEEELRRDLTCPKCKLEHGVFGLATWCPDCGANVFAAHFGAELEVITRMLGDVPRRADSLGARAAAKDVENALEDLVTTFEAVLKIVTRQALRAKGMSGEEINEIFRTKVRTNYLGIRTGAAVFESLLGLPLLESLTTSEADSLEATFEKRHPITHNLGVVDRKYLTKAQTGELEGREVRVTREEVTHAVVLVHRVLTRAHERATGGAAAAATA